MKKLKCPSLVAVLPVLLLTSCVNRHTDYFVSGKYQSTDIYISTNTGTITYIDTNYIYYLEVEEISYDNYILANGVNVVKDDVLKENYYFSIKFYRCLDNNQKFIDLINLKPTPPNVDAQPISYTDDNEIRFAPFYSGDESIIRYYYVTYETEHIAFERIE